MSTHSESSPSPSPLADLGLRWAGFPLDIIPRIVALEVELDEIHPGWRTFLRFDIVEYNRKARIKWLLKRHELLTHREQGIPAPRDWDVLIVRDTRRKDQCYAHPVLPPVDSSPAVTREPAKVSP